MAEYKQYVTQEQANGCVMISEDVIATIAEHALSDVDGVAGIASTPVSDIADLIGKKNWGKGIKIQICDDNSLTIDCNITIGYGSSVVDTAAAAQASVSAAVESMTGVKVNSVNVNVCGIVRQ